MVVLFYFRCVKRCKNDIFYEAILSFIWRTITRVIIIYLYFDYN